MPGGRVVVHTVSVILFAIGMVGLCLSTAYLIQLPPAAVDASDWKWIAIGQSALGLATWFSFAVASISGRSIDAAAQRVPDSARLEEENDAIAAHAETGVLP